MVTFIGVMYKYKHTNRGGIGIVPIVRDVISWSLSVNTTMHVCNLESKIKTEIRHVSKTMKEEVKCL